MGRKYQVISGDGHVETPPDALLKYVPQKWRNRAPRLISLPTGGEGWLIEGRPLIHNGQNIAGRGPIKMSGASYFKDDGSPAEGAGNAAQRLREQDIDGLDAEVLFPPVFASRFIESISDKDVYRALIRAYNTFLAKDYCSVAPDRLIGNAAMPITGVDDAIDELEHAAELGLRSVCFYQFPNGSGHPEPDDDRFWARALDLDMALSPHFGFGDVNPPPFLKGQDTASWSFASVLSQRVAGIPPIYCMAQLISSGVFDRFPEIGFYFAETNIAWLPWCMFIFEDNYKLFRHCYDVEFEKKPSEYILDHCYFGMLRDPLGCRMLDQIPPERVMFGTDFPHSVGSFPNTRKYLDEAFEGVDPAHRRKVLLETPARFYKLDLEADITETPAL